jgi:Putative Actinobacterial Holin-X, holin superfamily III
MAISANTRPSAVASSNGAGAKDASIGELVATASRDVTLLLRQEVELAKTEVKAAATSAGIGAGFLAVAGLLGFFAFMAITIAAAEGLHAAGIGLAYSYLIVTGVYLIVAGLLALFGVARLKKVGPPTRAIQTVKDDVAWIKHPTVAPTTKIETH